MRSEHKGNLSEVSFLFLFFLFFFFSFGRGNWDTQGLLQALLPAQKSLLVDSRETIWDARERTMVDPRLDTCKASTLSAVLSLQPLNVLSLGALLTQLGQQNQLFSPLPCSAETCRYLCMALLSDFHL